MSAQPPHGQPGDIFDGTLWFFTQENSLKGTRIPARSSREPQLRRPRRSRYVSVSGTASISRDREKMKELWSPIHKAWFPKGLDDPNIALLRVEVTKPNIGILHRVQSFACSASRKRLRRESPMAKRVRTTRK